MREGGDRYVVAALWPSKAVLVREGQDWLDAAADLLQVPPAELKVGDVVLAGEEPR